MTHDGFGAPLGRDFYARSVLTLARDCVGKVLVHRIGDSVVAGRIVETEAYRGPDDRAAHSFGGRRTARTEVMYGPAGFVYMFLIYGLHYQFNIVAGRPGEPHAVLVRALEPLAGVEFMAARRKLAAGHRNLTNGPGKLCQALDLTLAAYGHDLCAGKLYLADGPRLPTVRSPRIGVDYALDWALKPWRYYAKENPYVSVISKQPAPGAQAARFSKGSKR